MFQVVARNNNRTDYILGEITAREAELVADDDSTITGKGLYLMVVDKENPRAPARVLAKFVSESAAMNLATFFRFNGFLER